MVPRRGPTGKTVPPRPGATDGLEEALLARGDEEAARAAFETARTQYRALGAERRVAECEGRLAAAAD